MEPIKTIIIDDEKLAREILISFLKNFDDIVIVKECENGFEGTLSADAIGITACLYAYSHLSFTDSPDFAEKCAQQYHLLREFMLEHPEAKAILKAID